MLFNSDKIRLLLWLSIASSFKIGSENKENRIALFAGVFLRYFYPVEKMYEKG